MGTLGRLLKFLLFAIPVGYGLMLGATEVHVSGGAAEYGFRNATEEFPLFQFLKRIPYLPTPRVIHVPQVDILDALWNAVFGFCTISLMGLALIPLFIGSVIAMIYGLVTAQWPAFLAGVLGCVMTPLLAIAVPIAAFALWLMLLIQPATPAYVVFWIILGLPFLAVAAAIAAEGPTYTITGRDILISRFTSGARYGVSGRDISIRGR